uniref:Uncharacterized protein n=1 Tax=Aegilops tauschii TaxID=37682 RepID=N1R4C5_AEGTA
MPPPRGARLRRWTQIIYEKGSVQELWLCFTKDLKETPNVESPYLTFTLTWLGVRLLHIWFMLYCLLTNKKIS